MGTGRPRQPSARKRLIDAVHAVRRTLTEIAWYPPHEPRTYFGSKFKAVETRLCHQEDLPCLVCGVRHSTLADPRQNPFGAKQMEAHHRLIEWSLSHAIDVEKFNSRIWPYLHSKHPEKYAAPFTEQELLDWIDHDPDNLWVLCDVHHRGKRHGIHSITGPIWGPQDLLKAAFVKDTEDRWPADPPKRKRRGA